MQVGIEIVEHLESNRWLVISVNYLAVGSMEGVVELFDVDLVDQMEPLHTFGKKSKKKKTKSSKKVRLKNLAIIFGIFSFALEIIN